MSRSLIGIQRENSLHASMKEFCRQPGDQVEVLLGRYVIDIIRGDQLFEIQTTNFHLIKTKLSNLLKDYKVRVVHPIARDRWILRRGKNGERKSRRRSPKHGRHVDIFNELVGLVDIIEDPCFSLEIVLVEDEITWLDDGKGSWRRKGWSIVDRKLIKVIETQLFEHPLDYLRLLPASLEETFTNSDLSEGLKIQPRLAQKMTYCLRKINAIEKVGTRQRFNLYAIAEGKPQ